MAEICESKVNRQEVLKSFRSFFKLNGAGLLKKNMSLDQILKLAMERLDLRVLQSGDYDPNEVYGWIFELILSDSFFDKFIDAPEKILEWLLPEPEKKEQPDLKTDIGLIKDYERSLNRLLNKNFIDRFYGYSLAKDKMLLSFEIEIVKALLLDIDLNRVTRTDADLNQYLIDYQKKLYKNILNYLESVHSTLNYSDKLFEFGINQLDRISQYLDELSLIDPSELLGLSTSVFKSDKLKLEAINSYFILKNFDKLIARLLSGVIKIKDSFFGLLVDKNDKYSVNKHKDSLNATGWQNDEIKTPGDVLNKRGRLIISTLKLYLLDGLFKGLYLNVDRVLYLIRFLKLQLRGHWGRNFKLFDEYGNLKQFTSRGVAINFSEGQKKFTTRNKIETLRDLVNSLLNNPTVGYKLLFEILNSDLFKTSNFYLKSQSFKNEGKWILDSLYKQMFAKENSIYSLAYENIYLNLIHFFNYSTFLPMKQQRINKEGDFETVTMSPLNIDSAIFDIKEAINSKFPMGRLDYFKSKYKVTRLVNESDPKKSKLIFYINVNNEDENLYDFKVEFTPSSQKYIVYDNKGLLVKPFVEYTDPILKKGPMQFTKMADFVFDVFGIDYRTDYNWRLELLLNKKIENPYDEALRGILLPILIPAFGNAMLLRESRKEIDKNLSDYGYNITDAHSLIEKHPMYLGYNLIPRNAYSELQTLGEILGTLDGQLTRSIMRTAEGTNVSVNVLYNLMAERDNQFHTQNNTNNSATQSLVLNAVENWSLTREMKYGMKSKLKVLFNFNESMYSAFILDFLNVKENDDVIRFTEAVNSDKPTSGSIEVSWVKDKGIRYILEKFGAEGVEQMAQKEFAPVYEKVYNNIVSDLKKLQDFINLHYKDKVKDVSNGVNIYKFEFDPQNNFTNFNNWCKLSGIDPYTFIMGYITVYNLTNRLDPIAFTDNVHFRLGKNGIEMNLAFISMLLRLKPELSTTTFLNFVGLPNDERALYNIKNYFMKNYLRMVDDCLDNNFQVKLYDEYHDLIKERWANKLRKVTDETGKWTRNDGIALAKIWVPDASKEEGGSWFKISDKFDLLLFKEKLKDGRYIDISDSSFNFEHLYDYLDESTEGKYKIVINPLLRQWAACDYYFTQKSVLMTNGSHVWSNAKKLKGTILEEEGAWNDFNKRNVENTATAKQFNLNGLNEISEYANIAVILDPKAEVLAAHGEKSSIKPFDGCTWVDAFQVYWENGSLGEDITGITKKPIIHFYNEKYASGGLIKTASFGITNEKMRNSMFFRRMMWKCSHHEWTDLNGKKISDIVDITTDYLGNKIDYSNMYYRENGEFYKIDGIYKNNNSDLYTVITTKCDKYGYNIGSEIVSEHKINSNYSLWKVLGGYNSYELKNGELILSEKSIKKVSQVGNKVGIKLSSDVIESQYDLYLFMKHSDIHYVVTEGAIKKGAANINSVDFYTNDIDYNFFKIRMANAGILLDPTHAADNATVSLMTLVIAALADRGFTVEAANDVYTALAKLTQNAILEDIDGYTELLQFGSKLKLLEILVKLIVDAFKDIKSNESNIAQSIASNIYTLLQTKNKLELSDIEDLIPWSDASVFKFLVSAVSSTLNKTAIKLHSFGSLSVLNPSGSGAIQLYGDKLLSLFADNPEKLIKHALKVESKVLKQHEIKIGRTYSFLTKDAPIRGVKRVSNLTDYYDFVDKIDTGQYLNVREAVYASSNTLIVDPNKVLFGLYRINYKDGQTVIKWVDDGIKDSNFKSASKIVLFGRDLDSYNILINNGNYSIYDLNSIRHKKDLLEKKLLLERIKNPSEELKFELLIVNQDLFEVLKLILSDLIKIKNKLSVLMRTHEGTKEVQVTDYDTLAYELLMPMIYLTKFGLKANDDVYDIVNDRLFFLKRFLEDIQSRVTSDYYEIELKRIGGNNIYLTTDVPIDCYKLDIDKVKDTLGNVYRVDSDGNKLYQMSSANDEVYIDLHNKGLGEIIVTDHPEFYIDNNEYFTILKSKNADNDKVLEILLKSEKTKNITLLLLESDFNEVIIKYNKSKNIKDIIELAKTNDAAKLLLQMSNRMYTSFKQSLSVLAARIPSQSMQSFMGMKVAGFVNTGINDCYVSDMLIWLLGSDFDVDKVTLMGNSFTDSGEFITWSRYMRLDDEKSFNITKKLKFPTGKDTTLLNNEYDLSKYLILFDEKGNLLVKHSDKEYYNKLELLVEMINNFSEELPGEESSLRNSIEKVINNHNHTKFFDETGALMNLIQCRSVDIALDVLNILATQAPIDNASEPLKNEAEKSPFGLKGKENRPGNPVAKILALRDNQVGKMDIAITASIGIKTFFALTLYYNSKLIDPKEDVKKLKFRVTLSDGTLYTTLCNIRTSDIEKLRKIDPELANNIESGFLVEADLVISGIMTLATDNAKELALSKLNAGQDILGLYLYGVIIGIPFEKLAKILTSGTAQVLREFCEGNIFLGTDDRKLKLGINYLKNGVKFNSDLFKEDSKILEMPGIDDFPLRVLNAVKLYHEGKPEEFQKLIDDVNKYFTPYINNSTNAARRNFVLKARKYVSDMFRIKSLDILHDIETLLYGLEELATIRDLIKNLGVKVKIEDKLKFYNRFSSIIKSRIGNYSLDSNVRESLYERMRLINGNDSTDISFIKYFTDPIYKQQIIDFYEEIKHTFNVFDVIENIPHYKKYLETVFADFARLNNSAKFKAMIKFTPLIKEAYGGNRDLLNRQYKKLDDFLSKVLINDYLKEFPVLQIPEGSYKILDDEIKISYTKLNIQLGTLIGNATFKLWVEHLLLPMLKRRYSNNKFIQDLNTKLYNLTEVHNNISALTLPIDMMARSDSEKTKLELYKADFAKLENLKQSFGNVEYTIPDIFFLYNLITYNNKTNKRALTPLTEILYKMLGNLTDSYRKHIARFDRLNDFVVGKHFTEDELLMAIAPKSTEVYASSYNGKYVYTYDYDELRFILKLKKDKKSKDENENFDENPELDFLQDEMMLDVLAEEEDSENTPDEDLGISKRRKNKFEENYTPIEYFDNPATIELGQTLSNGENFITKDFIGEFQLSDIFSIDMNKGEVNKIIYKSETEDLKYINPSSININWTNKLIDGKMQEVVNDMDLIIQIQHKIKTDLKLCP